MPVAPPVRLPPLVLTTVRLQLRPYEAADAEDFFAVLDQGRARFQASFPERVRAVRTLADVPEQLASFAHDWRTGRFYVFGIWHLVSQAYLGDICLMPQREGQAEIGYYLAAAAEGQGYAREALGAIIRFGFEQVGVEQLLIRCFVDNVRGQHVALAQGFRLLKQVPAFAYVPWHHFRRWSTERQRPAILHFVLAK